MVDRGGWGPEYALQRELGYVQLFSGYWEGIKVVVGIEEEREREKAKEIETERGREEEKRNRKEGGIKLPLQKNSGNRERKTGENRGQLASSEKEEIGSRWNLSLIGVGY